MRIRHLKPAVAEADMTPMIDMTFQLIAFFMIVTNFEQMQADERVRLPVDELAVPPESARQDDIVVNIGYIRNETTGEKEDEDPFIFLGDNKDGIRILESDGYFNQERQRQVVLAGEDSLDEVTIVIRADRDVPTGLVQEMMRIAQESGFTRFSLKAEKGQDEPPQE